jgi:glycosyltransferase involved in cell wall biosynthesis
LSRGHFAHLPWALAAALQGKPVIHIMNGFIHDASTTHGMSFATRWISDLSYRIQFRLASRVVAVTAEIAGHISSRYRTNGVVVINNGVNTAVLHPTDVRTTGRPFAIFPSSLAPWHDAETIFEAVADPAWPDDLDVVIVGEGSNSDSIRKSAEASRRVRFMGLQPTAALRKLMQEARIGLCLVVRQDARNINEVRPLKLFEMMACGLPVVVTDLPGQRDVVTASGGGIIVPERDPAALAAAVRDLHRRKDLAMVAAKAADHVATHHTWSASAALLQKLIFEATGARSAA